MGARKIEGERSTDLKHKATRLKARDPEADTSLAVWYVQLSRAIAMYVRVTNHLLCEAEKN